MEKIDKEKQIIVVDPSKFYERRLKYEEKHSMWEGFKAVYWSIYILSLGLYLLYPYPNSTVNDTSFFGMALVLFAFFYIIFGLTKMLHLKLMKRVA
ncbi:MAG: hypothetical protein M1538_01755 [Candidatus Marsarchaeota archaeon]|jgi:hypothetical protein|nr:hypothetical protein [Candidatus Marsarchaeota archaeon]